MIHSVEITNFKNESILLELSNPWDTGIAITNIEGCGGGNATINTTEMATGDISWFNSARLQTRNIIFSLKPLNLPDSTMEENRHKIYKYFQPKKLVKMVFNTDTRQAEANGYVESVSVSIFSSNETVQVSVLCLDPNFYSETGETTVFSGVRPLFEFPFADDSVKANTSGNDYNANQLFNWDWTKPINDQTEDNPNLIKDHNLTLLSYPIPSTDTDGWALSGANGTANLYHEGVRLERPADSVGTSTLRFRISGTTYSQMANGKYTWSIITVEHGLQSITFDIQKTENTVENMFATGIYITTTTFANKVEVGVRVMAGYSITISDCKLESGSTQTLISTVVPTTWHKVGVTIRDWEILQTNLGLSQVTVVSGGLRLLDYAENEVDFLFGSKVVVTRGSQMTASVLISQVYSTTFTIPETGEFTSTPLDISNHFTMEFHIAAGTSIGEFRFRHNKDVITVNSDQIIVKAVKLEYGNKQTLANGGSIIYDPGTYNYTGGTLEFGEILLDTRAILPYAGDADTGVVITIHATAGASNITIRNINTGEEMTIDTTKVGSISGKAFDDGDDIIINTKTGEKSVILRREGVETNIIGAVAKNSDWFTLTNGDNLFAFYAVSGEENLMVTFDYRVAYGGI